MARIVDHPYTRIFIALILITVGVIEALGDVRTHFSWRSLGAHHGVIILGIFQLLKAMVEVLEGVRTAFENRDEEAKGAEK